jgi:DNA-binding transcriptional regulator YiaG
MNGDMITPTMANHPNRGRSQSTARNPTAAEVRAARETAGLTQAEAAELIYSTLRAWQNWEADGGEEARRMHPGLFELFVLKTKHPEIFALIKKARR